MKILAPLLLLALLYSCSAKKSISKQEIANNSSSEIDTTYIENPETGDIQMIITKKSGEIKSGKIKRIPPAKSGDTIYYENPDTGNLEMKIID